VGSQTKEGGENLKKKRNVSMATNTHTCKVLEGFDCYLGKKHKQSPSFFFQDPHGIQIKLKKYLFIAMKRSTNIIGFPNLEDKVLKDKVSEEVLEDVLKVIVHKVE